MNVATKCSKCGQPFLITDSIEGHESATWHSVCPVMPQPDNNLRKSLEDIAISEDRFGDELLEEPLGNYPEAIDKVLDTIISQLPKPEKLDERDEESRYMSYGKGFNDSLAIVEKLLTNAREDK